MMKINQWISRNPKGLRFYCHIKALSQMQEPLFDSVLSQKFQDFQ